MRTATLGTPVKPTAAGAVRVHEITIAPEPGPGGETIEREYLSEDTVTAVVGSDVLGKKGGSWALKADVIPSGAAGTVPELHQVFRQAFGTATNVSSTSEAYTPSAQESDHGAIDIYSLSPRVGLLAAIGCFTEMLKISQQGPTPPAVEASGKAKDVILTAPTLYVSNVGAAVTITTGDGAKGVHEAGGMVAFRNPTTGANVDTNSGAGYRINSRSGDVSTLDGTPSGVSSGDAIDPYLPAPSYGSTALPLGGTIATIQVTPSGGSAIALPEVQAWEFSIGPAGMPIDDVVGSATFADIVQGRMSIKASVTFYLRRDKFITLARHRANAALSWAVSIVVGNAAGSIMTIALPQAVMKGLPLDLGPKGVSKVTLSFEARASAYGTNDQASLTFT